MATRSVVGRTVGNEDTWIGKYVHWDGYPSNMVPTIIELVLRHNLNDVVSTIVFEQPSWSLLSFERPNYLKEEDDHIAGYGIPSAHKEELWITWEMKDVMSTEYAYIIDPTTKSLHVLSRNEDSKRWDKLDVVDLGAIIYRVRNGESTIEEEITKSWQSQSVLAI
jgi:hypothetical protein